MSNFNGTVVADAIVPNSSNPTHYDVFGQGGHRSVRDQDQLYDIACGETLDADGLSSGLRRAGMLVHVVEEQTMYVLQIPDFNTLSDSTKLAALADNANWTEFSGAGQQDQMYTKEESDALLAGKADLVGGVVPAAQLPAFVSKSYVDGADAALSTRIDTTSAAAVTSVAASVAGQSLTITTNKGVQTVALPNQVVQVISKTYAELTALIAASALQPGNYYQIADYQTIHIIPNTTVVCENGVTVGAAATYAGGNYATNGGEPLVILALSGNRLSSQAYSLANPLDEIDYNVTAVAIGNGKFNKGTITRRKDTQKNVETMYDFRTARNRRFKCLGVKEDYTATVSGSTLVVPAACPTSYVLVRCAGDSTVPVNQIQFSNKTVNVFNHLFPDYLVSGQIYLLNFWNVGTTEGEYCTVLSCAAMESRLLNRYIGVNAVAIDTIGYQALRLSIDPAAYQDVLTFGNYTSTSNVRLGKVVTTATNNITFAAGASNIILSDAANCAIAGTAAGLICDGQAVRSLTVTGNVSYLRLARGCSSILVANQATVFADAQSTFASVTCLGLQSIVFQGAVTICFFESDGTARSLSGTVFNAITTSVISGTFSNCKFAGNITNTYIGHDHDDNGGNASDLTIFAPMRYSMFALSSVQVNWFPALSTNVVRGYLTNEDVTVKSTTSGKFFTQNYNQTTSTMTYIIVA